MQAVTLYRQHLLGQPLLVDLVCHLRFELLGIADVDERADEAQRAPFRAQQRNAFCMHPHIVAIGASHAVIERLVVAGAAGHAAVAQLADKTRTHAFEVFRMQQVIKRRQV